MATGSELAVLFCGIPIQENQVLVPLHYFHGPEKTTQIPGGAIYPTSNKIIEGTEANGRNSYLEVHKNVAIMNVPEDESPRTVLDRVLVVLKLFLDAEINANYYIYGNENTVQELRHYRIWGRGKIAYHIYDHILGELISFWEKHATIDPHIFPVRSFNYADFEPEDSGEVKRYVEALEYLLVPDSVSGEIGYKFAQRGAMVFANNDKVYPEESKGIYNFLKEAYNYRSALTHGRSLPSFSRIKIARLREYCARGIEFFFERNLLEDTRSALKKRADAIKEETVFRCIRRPEGV